MEIILKRRQKHREVPHALQIKNRQTTKQHVTNEENCERRKEGREEERKRRRREACSLWTGLRRKMLFLKLFPLFVNFAGGVFLKMSLICICLVLLRYSQFRTIWM